MYGRRYILLEGDQKAFFEGIADIFYECVAFSKRFLTGLHWLHPKLFLAQKEKKLE